MAIAEPSHSPDGKNRCGADAAHLGGLLVMQAVNLQAIKTWILRSN